MADFFRILKPRKMDSIELIEDAFLSKGYELKSREDEFYLLKKKATTNGFLDFRVVSDDLYLFTYLGRPEYDEMADLIKDFSVTDFFFGGKFGYECKSELIKYWKSNPKFHDLLIDESDYVRVKKITNA